MLETRQRLGLTQGALRSLLGVSENSVRNWERGRRQPRGLRLRSLQQILEPSDASSPFPIQRDVARPEDHAAFADFVGGDLGRHWAAGGGAESARWARITPQPSHPVA